MNSNKIYTFTAEVKRKLFDFKEKKGAPDSYELVFKDLEEEYEFSIESVQNIGELNKRIYTIYRDNDNAYSSVSMFAVIADKRYPLVQDFDLSQKEKKLGSADDFFSENDTPSNINPYANHNMYATSPQSLEAQLAVMNERMKLGELWKERENTLLGKIDDLKEKIRELESNKIIAGITHSNAIKALDDKLNALQKEREDLLEANTNSLVELGSYKATDRVTESVKGLYPIVLGAVKLLGSGEIAKNAGELLSGLEGDSDNEIAEPDYLTEEGKMIDELLSESFTDEMKSMVVGLAKSLKQIKSIQEARIMQAYLNESYQKIQKLRKGGADEAKNTTEE